MTGLSKEAIVGNNYLEMISSKNLTHFKARNSEIKNPQQEESSCEGTITRKDGSILRCGVILSTIQDPKTKENLHMIQLQDLSAVQKAEEMSVRLREEQEKTTRVYERDINHEVRTSVGQIASFAEILKNRSNSEEANSINELSHVLIEKLDGLLTFPGREVDQSKTSNLTSSEGKKASVSFPLESKIAALQGKKVFIVDDSSVNRRIIGKMIEGAGMQCEYFTDGVEVVARLENVKKEDPKVDVVLMDLSMTTMGGTEATREIRKKHPNLPIIAVTGDGISAKQECRDVKMNAFCSKPYNKDAIFSRMYKLAIEEKSGWVSDDE